MRLLFAVHAACSDPCLSSCSLFLLLSLHTDTPAPAAVPGSKIYLPVEKQDEDEGEEECGAGGENLVGELLAYLRKE